VNVIDDSSSPSQIKDQVVSNPPPPLSASPLGAKTARIKSHPRLLLIIVDAKPAVFGVAAVAREVHVV
jgi:hypothetical protein